MKWVKQRHMLFLLLALVALIGAVWAMVLFTQPPQYTLDQRVYNVASQLKCPVCSNESVADSSASIAVQMRQVVRQRVQAGQSEQQVLAYFASQYGQQIVLVPPKQGINLLAWLMPVAVFLLGLALMSFVVHDWRVHARLQKATLAGQAWHEEGDDPELARYREQLERELEDGESFF